MRDLRIAGASVHDIVIEIFNGVVPQEASASNHPESDSRLLKRSVDPIAICLHRRVQDDGKRKAGTLSGFALDDKAIVAVELLLKQGQVSASYRRHRRQFLEL